MRILDSKGESPGVLTRDEALAKAKELGLDLIEIAPNADPPVARICNFQKFRYEENKKERAARKGSSEGSLKELWLSPRIAEHDLQVRLSKTEEFLKEGHKVKLTVKFKGREMAHPEIGRQVLQEALEKLGDKVTIDREPKFEGRKLSLIITKTKQSLRSNDLKGVKNAETENKQVSL